MCVYTSKIQLTFFQIYASEIMYIYIYICIHMYAYISNLHSHGWGKSRCGRGSGFDHGRVAVFSCFFLCMTRLKRKGTCLVGPVSKYGYFPAEIFSLDDHAHCSRENIFAYVQI